jgi:heat shock protein HtpX
MTMTVFLLGLLYVVFFGALLHFSALTAGPVIVIAAVLLIAQYWTSDRIALATARAKIVSEQEQPELHASIQRLCITADLPMPRVAIIDSDMPNAFATGRSPRHAAVAVTTGLLSRLEPHELEGVLAHELSHVKHRDVAVMTLASFFAMVSGMIMRFGFYFGMFGGFDDEEGDSGQAFLITMLVSIAVYAISFVLIRALSRYREFAADRGACVLTKSPSSLASALNKISGSMARIPQRDLRTAESMNQFFIIPVGLKSGLSNVFSTHPTLDARLEQLRRIERQLETL